MRYAPNGASHISRYEGAQAPATVAKRSCGPFTNTGGRNAESWILTITGTLAVAGSTKPPFGEVASVNPA